jgi:disulfide bond formation protein DsbB
MYPIEFYNYWLAVGTLVMQIVGVALLVLFFLRKKFPDLEDVAALLEKWGLWKAFTLALIGVAITLLYSEILGIAPCGWCWVQRVFLYPQLVLFAVALWKNDRRIADYSIALSVFGGAVALYQHYLQMGGTSVLPCPATASQAVDCSVRFLFEFNYITFPLASFTLFAFLIVLMLFVRHRPR